MLSLRIRDSFGMRGNLNIGNRTLSTETRSPIWTLEGGIRRRRDSDVIILLDAIAADAETAGERSAAIERRGAGEENDAVLIWIR